MGFLYGFIGAVLGAILGLVTEFVILTITEDGDEFGVAFMIAVLGLIGLIVGAIAGIVIALLLLRYVKRHQIRGYIERKTILIVAGFVVSVPVLVAAMLWITQQCGNPPSDQALLDNYFRHHTTFGVLGQMKLADKNLSRVDYNWTEPSNPKTIGVSPARIGKYRSLLESVGLHRGFEGYKGETDFISWCQGSAISSDTDKGYAYLTVPPKQSLNSLDHYRFSDSGDKVYRHIEGCWYLYYDYIPG